MLMTKFLKEDASTMKTRTTSQQLILQKTLLMSLVSKYQSLRFQLLVASKLVDLITNCGRNCCASRGWNCVQDLPILKATALKQKLVGESL